jgi:hypothetical protein
MGINHVLQVRKVQGEEERAMKRYDLRIGEFLDQRIDIVEQDNGKYVKYSDIKDDRKLLEEAVNALQQAYELNDYWGETNISRWTREIENNIKSILARAKERLGK